MTSYTQLAREILAGGSLAPETGLAILECPDDELLALLHGAFLLRRQRFGRGVLLHVIRNAKSGDCTENCAYCSQSSVSTGDVSRYPLQSVEQMVSGARQAQHAGAVRYCIVTAGRSLSFPELETIGEAVTRIKAETQLSICVSLGELGDEQALYLKQVGVDRYNHNLETSARHFPALCQTHGYPDRVQTARRAKQAGLELCSGVLLGTGEALEDRVEVAFALRELHIDSLPVNFLDPRSGTPLAARSPLSARDALRALCLFRFVHPQVELRVAGGRERILGPLQALALYPANSLFTAGYLTTPGQGLAADRQLIEMAGFFVTGLAE